MDSRSDSACVVEELEQPALAQLGGALNAVQDRAADPESRPRLLDRDLPRLGWMGVHGRVVAARSLIKPSIPL